MQAGMPSYNGELCEEITVNGLTKSASGPSLKKNVCVYIYVYTIYSLCSMLAAGRRWPRSVNSYAEVTNGDSNI